MLTWFSIDVLGPLCSEVLRPPLSTEKYSALREKKTGERLRHKSYEYMSLRNQILKQIGPPQQ